MRPQTTCHKTSLYTGTLMDSFDIAQWADAHRHRDDGAKLFPAGQFEVIRKYDLLTLLHVASQLLPSICLCSAPPRTGCQQ